MTDAAPVAAFWCRIPSRPNFGDALTPWLIRRLTGRYPRFAPADDPGPKYLVTGSVIASAGPGTTVWGAGIMNRNDDISPLAKLLAVRGPLTRARALACGADCPEVYGDPALLLPRLHRPAPTTRRGIGVVLHFSDAPRHPASPASPGRPVRRIDIQAPIEQVIEEVASCELVASSSLHGIIAAHAYGVPAVWLKLRDLPSGDDTKFRDYFSSIDRDPTPPLRACNDQIDPDALWRAAVAPPAIDLEPLWRACPFREAA